MKRLAVVLTLLLAAPVGAQDAVSTVPCRMDGTDCVVGGVTDGDKGDVTVSASGATWTIDDLAVSFAKFVAATGASKLVGRGSASGGGAFQEITLGTGLTMTGTTLSAGGITNGAANNVIPKSDGTNLVTSNLSDSGTAVTSAVPVSIPITLGPDVVTNGSFAGGTTDWTVPAGWAYGTDNVGKTGDGTGALEQTGCVAVVGGVYIVTYTVSSVTAGSWYVQFGGQDSGSTRSSAGAYTEIIMATSTGDLKVIPSDAARLVIDDVSVKRVTLANRLNISPWTVVGDKFAVYLDSPGRGGILSAGSYPSTGVSPHFAFSDYRRAANGIINLAGMVSEGGAISTNRQIVSSGTAGGTYDPATGVLSISGGDFSQPSEGYMFGAKPDIAGPGYACEAGTGAWHFQAIQKNAETGGVPWYVFAIEADGSLSWGVGTTKASMDAGVKRTAAGKLKITNGSTGGGNLNITTQVYANNAAAVAGGLVAGDLYRTGADPDPVMIVH